MDLGRLRITPAHKPLDVVRDAVRATNGFVVLRNVDPTILHDIRYYTAHNFVGIRIDGYHWPLCILTGSAAPALRKVQRSMLAQGNTLKAYDCYRPQRAVDHFVRWAKPAAVRARGAAGGSPRGVPGRAREHRQLLKSARWAEALFRNLPEE